MQRIFCDICNDEINDSAIIKIKRSIFQLFRLIPDIIVQHVNYKKKRVYTKYLICYECKARLEQFLFGDQNTVEELRTRLHAIREEEARDAMEMEIRPAIARTGRIPAGRGYTAAQMAMEANVAPRPLEWDELPNTEGR